MVVVIAAAAADAVVVAVVVVYVVVFLSYASKSENVCRQFKKIVNNNKE